MVSLMDGFYLVIMPIQMEQFLHTLPIFLKYTSEISCENLFYGLPLEIINMPIV